MAGRRRPGEGQVAERLGGLDWKARMRLEVEEHPGRDLHALAKRYGVGLQEVEEALEIDPSMDVVVGEFGRKAVPVLSSPSRYSEAIRKRAKVSLSNVMSCLMDKERVEGSSTTALATLVPVLIRMITGDLQIDPLAEAGKGKVYSKEELVLTLKRSVTKVAQTNPVLAKDIAGALREFAEKGDAAVLEAVFPGGGDGGGGGGDSEEGK